MALGAALTYVVTDKFSCSLQCHSQRTNGMDSTLVLTPTNGMFELP